MTMTIIGLLTAGFHRLSEERSLRIARREARARLAGMDDRLLADIGLERAAVIDEARQPSRLPLGLASGARRLSRRPEGMRDAGAAASAVDGSVGLPDHVQPQVDNGSSIGMPGLVSRLAISGTYVSKPQQGAS